MRTKIKPPPGSCDTHAHVFGPFAKYPLAAVRDWTPPERPLEDYAALLNDLGIDRAVIVHSSSHGTDNRVTLDAIARLGERCRGIALVPPSISEDELAALHAGGMRGVRISTMLKGELGIEHLEDISARIQPLGWQVQLHFGKPEELLELEPLLRRLPVDIVIDHLGRVRGGGGIDDPVFRALLRLLSETDRCWTKICSWYRASDSGPPFDDIRKLIEAAIKARADRLLWGSNWPHPQWPHPDPDDAELLDQLQTWAGEHRFAILVDNPARLFGFETRGR